MLVLGIDWHARSVLQGRSSRSLPPGSWERRPRDGSKLLREVGAGVVAGGALLALCRLRGEAGTLAPSAAESEPHAASGKARSRFRRELIRNEGGELTTEETGPVAIRPEEGAGTVVVSLILVSRRPLVGQAGMSNAAEIRVALADRSALNREDLVAIEVVWSPAAEDDRMSTAELEQHYPELVLIDPKSIAGRLFCSYCGGVFAMELLNCPHCGGAVDKGAPERGECMSLFDYPRINFKGTIQLNPGTANNDDYARRRAVTCPRAGDRSPARRSALIDSKLVQPRTYGMSDDALHRLGAEGADVRRAGRRGPQQIIPAEWNYYGDMSSSVTATVDRRPDRRPGESYDAADAGVPLSSLIGAALTFSGGITDVNSEGSPPATQFFIDS